MKKAVIGVVLAAILTTGTAFASPVHPDGLGIGIMGGFGTGGVGSAALSLKLPTLPVFWGINAGFWTHGFSLGVQGDVYLRGSMLVDDVLGWFFGLGGYVGFASHSDETVIRGGVQHTRSWTRIGFGLRAPIGLTVQLIELLEVFVNLAPSVGINIFSNDNAWDDRYSGVGLGVGLGGELGLRFWL